MCWRREAAAWKWLAWYFVKAGGAAQRRTAQRWNNVYALLRKKPAFKLGATSLLPPRGGRAGVARQTAGTRRDGIIII